MDGVGWGKIGTSDRTSGGEWRTDCKLASCVNLNDERGLMERPINATRVRRWALLAIAAVAGMAACAQPRVAELYPQVEEYQGREIAELTFVDPAPFTDDSLDALTETRETGCSLLGFLPFCFPGTDWGRRTGRVDMRQVGSDLARLAALYRQNGYFGTRVVPEIEDMPEGDAVRFRFVVERGDGIVMDSVVVEGTEGIADPDSLEAVLPLQAGNLFDLNEFLASADTVTEALRRRGHAYAEVLRNYAVDTIQDRATVWLIAVPGPRVVVDSIIVSGLQELGRTDVLRQMVFEENDLLRLSDLRLSQRNLYELNLVRFAAVAVAADSVQLTPEDSTTATVRVSISEAAEYVVEAGVSFGSVDCFGGHGQWTDRSVLGGGRQVTVRGAVSRIGLGDPVSGLQGSLCSRGADREIATNVDYRVGVDFTQPYFLSPRNQVIATAFSERQSEPDLFQRTATGGRVAVTHWFGPGEFLTGAIEGEHRTTVGRPVLYCFELRACTAGDIAQFTGGRWRNGLSASWIRDRSNSTVNPTSGYILRSSTSWSTALLASDYDFLRLSGEGAMYHSVGKGWVVAGFARVGTFLTRATLGPNDFIPPEERFFAGGASSVRGFDRSTLGPGLYLMEDSLTVDFFPTGGTSVAVLSAEARLPSPFLRDLVRLAAFVDAGTVGLAPLWDASSQWRVTPGAGLRIQTPVGPARIDIGYNPYPPPSAALLEVDAATGDLIRVADSFQPAEPSRWNIDRFTLHIAVGQAF